MINAKAIEIPTRSGNAQCIAFKPDGVHLVVGESSGNLYQWKVDGGEDATLSAMQAKGNVYAVAVSADGQWVASGDLGNKVTVWNAVTHQLAIQVSEHTSYIYAVDISSDSKRIASGSQDLTVRVFDITSGARVLGPLQHNAAVVGVKFSPDGNRIATSTYQYPFVGVFDACSGNKLFEISVQVTWAPITPLVWSSDNQQLFVGSPGKITYLETSTSSHSEWTIHNGNNNVSVATHGRLIACSTGSSVSFWDYTSRTQIGSIIDHASSVNSIAISHDGRYLACGREKGVTVHDLTDFLPRDYLHARLLSRIPLVEVPETVFNSWALGNPLDTERLLSEEIARSADPSHYMFAARSLVRARLKEWEAATEDAEMSLQIEQSPIGQIAMSLALVGAGNPEDALDDFDFVFRDGDRSDNLLLLVIKSIFVFLCGKRKQAVSRLRGLVTAADPKTKDHYAQVLGFMYLKQGDYDKAVDTVERAKIPPTSEDSNPLITISLVFNWNFDNLKATAWQRLCESLYATARIKEVGETLLKMVRPFAEEEKESAHGRILEGIVTRSGQVTLLTWTGKSSKCNSCLPSSPDVYSREPVVHPHLDKDELAKRVDELRNIFPLADALVIYGRLTRLQPVRFAHFHLHIPCIVFGVRSITKGEENSYHAETTELGAFEFTTADALPLKEPRRLVLVDVRLHGLLEPQGGAAWEYSLEPDVETYSEMGTSAADSDAELVRGQIIEEAPDSSTTAPADAYTRALQLIAHLAQPFTALLLLQQPDGAYKRVAADHEIVVRGTGNNFPKDVRVEVLEIL